MPTTFPSTTQVPSHIFLLAARLIDIQNQADVEKGLTAAKSAGLTVFRTWGFNDKNRTYVQNGLPNYGTGESNDVVFQWFNKDGTSTINLAAFDKVVNAALKTDIKLVVALTNNWADYGGMDVYTVNLGGKYHDDVSTLKIMPGAGLTLPVLPHAPNQGRLQALRQGGCHPVQGLARHHGLGARERAPLRRRRDPEPPQKPQRLHPGPPVELDG